MNPQTPRTLATHSARKEPSLARAGILLGLVLIGSLAVGVWLAGRPEPETASVHRVRATQRTAAPATQPTPTVSTPVAAPAPTPMTTVAVESEPAAASTTIEENLTPAGPVTYEDAEAAYLSGEYDVAADLFAHYTADKPSNPWGHYMSGLAFRRVGQLDEAESAFLACLAIDPDHVKALVNLGRVRLDADNAADAEEVVRRAVTLDPENVDAHRVLARALHTLGNRDEALDEYAAALSIDPADAWSLNNRGLILIEEERFAEAVESLTSACNADATHAVFHNNQGVALERTGRFHDAELAYSGALELDSAYDKAAVSLARVEGKENVEEPLTAAYASASADEEGISTGGAASDLAALETPDSAPESAPSAPASPPAAPQVSRLDDPR